MCFFTASGEGEPEAERGRGEDPASQTGERESGKRERGETEENQRGRYGSYV